MRRCHRDHVSRAKNIDPFTEKVKPLRFRRRSRNPSARPGWRRGPGRSCPQVPADARRGAVSQPRPSEGKADEEAARPPGAGVLRAGDRLTSQPLVNAPKLCGWHCKS